MIITNIYGGLGNQMFQYALGKSISISQNSKLLLDISMFKQYTLHSFLLNKFNLSCQLAAEEDLKRFNLTNRYKRFLFRHFNYIAFKFDIFLKQGNLYSIKMFSILIQNILPVIGKVLNILLLLEKHS